MVGSKKRMHFIIMKRLTSCNILCNKTCCLTLVSTNLTPELSILQAVIGTFSWGHLCNSSEERLAHIRGPPHSNQDAISNSRRQGQLECLCY